MQFRREQMPDVRTRTPEIGIWSHREILHDLRKPLMLADSGLVRVVELILLKHS